MNHVLVQWIAQNESWRTTIDLALEPEAEYPFLERARRYHTALLDAALTACEEESADDLLAAARAFESFASPQSASLIDVAQDQKRSLIISAALYYLAGYPASSTLRARAARLSEGPMVLPAEVALHDVLARPRQLASPEGRTIAQRLAERGDISDVVQAAADGENQEFQYGPHRWLLAFLWERVMTAFQQRWHWGVLEPVPAGGLADQYVRRVLVERDGTWELFKSQQLAAQSGLLTQNGTYTLQMPTSSGKTSICELAILGHLDRNPNGRVVFFAPFRALAAELQARLRDRFSTLNVSVAAVFGGNSNDDDIDLADLPQVLISTPEKFVGLATIAPGLIDAFSMVICDEGHLLDSASRGVDFEMLLSRFRATSHERSFVFLSAVLPNVEAINGWLGGKDSVVRSDYRPTVLDYGVAHCVGKPASGYIRLDVNPHLPRPQSYFIQRLISKANREYVNPSTGRRNTYSLARKRSATVMTARRLLSLGTVGVFAPHRGGSMGATELVAELAAQAELSLDLPDPNDFVRTERATDYIEYIDYLLGPAHPCCIGLRHGAVLHHGQLPQEVREALESALRDEVFSLVVCTSTLAEGVNLPIRAMVVHSAKRFDGKVLKDMLTRDVANLVGRAGRAGHGTRGLVVSMENRAILDRLVRGGNEPARGPLYLLMARLSEVVAQAGPHAVDPEEWADFTEPMDSAVVAMLLEEMDEAQLKDVVRAAVSHSFAYYQSDEEQRERLMGIFAERAIAVWKLRTEHGIGTVRAFGGRTRSVGAVLPHVVASADGVVLAEEPSGRELWQALRGGFEADPTVQDAIEDCRQKVWDRMDFEFAERACRAWMSGSTYAEIAEAEGVDVEVLLGIMDSVVWGALQRSAESIVQYLDLQFAELGVDLPTGVRLLPTAIRRGYAKRQHFVVRRAGLRSRVGVHWLCSWMPEGLDSGRAVREYVGTHSADLTAALRTAGLPRLIVAAVDDWVDSTVRG